MGKFRAWVVAAAFIVATGAAATTAEACLEPNPGASGSRAGPDSHSRGSGYAGDPVQFWIDNTEEGAKYDVFVDGKQIESASGVDTDRSPGVYGKSFPMPDLGSKSHIAYVSIVITHDDIANSDHRESPTTEAPIYYLAAGTPVP